MAAKFYPGMGTDGWLTTPTEILDAALADFYMSEKSQDYIFPNSIASLPWIIQKNTGYMDETAAAIRSDLTAMLMKYFDTVEVSATPVETPDLMAGIITLFVSVTSDTEKIQLNNLLRISGSRLEDVRDAISGKSVLKLGA